jgi:hypothetical protein
VTIPVAGGFQDSAPGVRRTSGLPTNIGHSIPLAVCSVPQALQRDEVHQLHDLISTGEELQSCPVSYPYATGFIVTGRKCMKPITRRNVLMLGGAASVAPLLGSASLSSALEPYPVTLVLNDGLAVRDWQTGEKLTSPVMVSYSKEKDKDGKIKRFFCRLPWAWHQGLAGNLKTENGDPPKHTFQFDLIVMGPKSKPTSHHVKLTVSADTYPGSCCFMCGDLELCIPDGHSFMCNGVEFTC